jgi:hypothetical protein
MKTIEEISNMYPFAVTYLTKRETETLKYILNNSMFRGNNEIEKHFCFLEINNDVYAVRCKRRSHRDLLWEIIFEL